MNNVILLIPILPLIGFLLNGLGRNILPKPVVAIIGCASILSSFILSLVLFNQIKTNPSISLHVYDFIRTATLVIPFDLLIDHLSILFLLFITGIGFLIHLYSTAYMHSETSAHYARYFAYLNLFVFSMLMLIMGGNYIIMFIGWEGVGLCSYLLIGYWFKNINYTIAAKKAFVMNRIGDLGFLLAIFWIINKLGTASYADVFSNIHKLSAQDISIISVLLFVGAMGKSAQLPLYTWLPDAMAGPTPVSALIHAATMVTAGIYMVIRNNVFYSNAPEVQTFISIVGLATALFAATIALKQNDIKKVLAYSTVSQLGYMFLGLGVGAYTGALFHVITHAFFKALLFLGAGSVIHAMHHEQDIRKMGGLRKYLPLTNITFLIGCLAIAGVPPFAGFFSKDEILAAAYVKSPILYFLGVIGALLTTFYMFRLYAMTFSGKFRGTSEQEQHLHESPIAMTIPLAVLAIFSTISGFIGIPEVFVSNAHWLGHFIDPILVHTNAEVKHHELSHTTEFAMMGGVTASVLIVIFISWNSFRKYTLNLAESTGLSKLLENKWYVDEIYNSIIVVPIEFLSTAFTYVVEKIIIDGFVNGVGYAINYTSRQIRLIQNGQVGTYILMMVLSLICILFIWINDGTIVHFLSKIF